MVIENLIDIHKRCTFSGTKFKLPLTISQFLKESITFRKKSIRKFIKTENPEKKKFLISIKFYLEISQNRIYRLQKITLFKISNFTSTFGNLTHIKESIETQLFKVALFTNGNLQLFILPESKAVKKTTSNIFLFNFKTEWTNKLAVRIVPILRRSNFYKFLNFYTFEKVEKKLPRLFLTDIFTATAITNEKYLP